MSTPLFGPRGAFQRSLPSAGGYRFQAPGPVAYSIDLVTISTETNAAPLPYPIHRHARAKPRSDLDGRYSTTFHFTVHRFPVPQLLRETPETRMSSDTSPAVKEGFQAHALVAAAAFPGAGHMVLGEAKRGFGVAIGVLGLFFGGIFLGGIDVIDSKEDRVWFLGQAFVGPVAFGVDYLHQNHFKVRDPATGKLRSARPDEGRGDNGAPMPIEAAQTPNTPTVATQPPNRKSIGKVNELGTLFAAIAGMMNLIAIIDAAYPTTRHGGSKSAGTEPNSAAGENGKGRA